METSRERPQILKVSIFAWPEFNLVMKKEMEVGGGGRHERSIDFGPLIGQFPSNIS